MPEEFGDFEWRGEGEEAEIALYAPDAATADGALRRLLPAARLPGVESPVHAAASDRGFGRVAVSGTHAAPDLFSAPEWGLVLVAEGFVEEDDLGPFVSRAGDPDAFGRRALSAGTRDWARPGNVGVFRVAEVFDSEGAGELGLEIGALAVVVG